MLDPKLLRQDPEKIAKILTRRGFTFDITLFNTLEQQRKDRQVQVQELQNQRNTQSKQLGIAKARGEDITAAVEQMGELGERLTQQENALREIQQQLQDLVSAIPNLPQDDVPDGLDEKSNVEVRRYGTPRQFDFTPRSHFELGGMLKMMDFEVAAKLTGSRFVVLADDIAHLQRALTQFMLDLHTQEHGYHELYVPHMVNQASLFGTGQLPKFRDDQFNIAGDFNYTMISTAEIPVTNLVRDEIIPEDQLPLRFVAHTPCYRSEAGSYGKDMQGMIRQHQFEKVELVRIEKPENSHAMHEELTNHAEEVLKRLELPYRVMLLSAGDMGFSSSKTYDLEVWLPAQNTYREISSCSNFLDFQARRMKARFRRQDGTIEYLHTLNGSGLAVGRTLIAVMENYQNADGSITIPEVLRKYMGGKTLIKTRG